MFEYLKQKWKELTCKHSYVFDTSTLVDTGKRKLVVYKCEKCGKLKYYVI